MFSNNQTVNVWFVPQSRECFFPRWTATLEITIVKAAYPTAASHDVTRLPPTPRARHLSASVSAGTLVALLEHAGVVEAPSTGTCWCIIMLFFPWIWESSHSWGCFAQSIHTEILIASFFSTSAGCNLISAFQKCSFGQQISPLTSVPWFLPVLLFWVSWETPCWGKCYGERWCSCLAW